MSNQLANETSPYLLQHQDNPVDWYPWGPEALEKSRAGDKPIFLSIGYSACHWCHVMAHESFENDEIAQTLNENFVSIKVDREERPDLDQIYMGALQVYLQMTRSGQGGGWPLSMFLTPELKPILGGTYWPPTSQYGRPGFADVLRAVTEFWRDRRDEILEQSERITQYLQEAGAVAAREATSRRNCSPAPIRRFHCAFDSQHGGFGAAPSSRIRSICGCCCGCGAAIHKTRRCTW